MNSKKVKNIDRECILTRVSQPANSKKEYAYRNVCDGTIERVKFKFYMGNNKLVKVRVYIDNKDGTRFYLMKYTDGAQDFIAGEDEDLEMQVSIPIHAGDILKVEIENEKIEACDVSVQVEINHFTIMDEIERKVGIR